MRTTFAAFCFTIAAFSATAEGIPSPKGYSDTLDLMYAFMADQPTITRQEFTDDHGLEVFLPDGTSLVLYPDNLTNYLQAADSDSGRQDVFDGHMQALLGTIAGMDDDPAGFSLTQIFPVLRRSGYISVAGEDVEILSDNFPGNLTVYYAIDYPDKVGFLSAETLAKTDFTEDQVRDAVAENLRGLLDHMQVEHHEYLDISWLQLDGYYESSLALATGFWTDTADDYDRLIMIVPNRNFMVFGEGNDPEVYEVLKSVADDIDQQFNGALTNEIYRWSDEGWVLDKDQG